jgi:hypothetical protein
MAQTAEIQTRPRIVVVLGMHRSGTSLCANVLHALGIDMADEASPSPANQRGHWERPQVNFLNDRVFSLFNRRWDDEAHVLSLPENWFRAPQVRAVQADIETWLRPMLQRPARLGFKDPRTARLLPMWHAVFATLNAEPVFVFCVRDPAQVARSIAARDRMGREQSEYRWLIYNAAAVTGVGDAKICIVPYESWFTAPEQTVGRLARFVGAPRQGDNAGRAAIAASLVDPALRHDDAAPETAASRLSRRLHHQVIACMGADGFNAPLRQFCESLSEFEHMVQPMLTATEVLRASVADQRRVIEDLNNLVSRLRRENMPAQ